MRNIQGAQHGLRACDKTEVSVVRTDKLQRQTVQSSKTPDKLIIIPMLLPQINKNSGTSDAQTGTEVSEEKAEKIKTKSHFTQGDLEPKQLGMWVLGVP